MRENKNQDKVLALFDFDGTITNKDSLFHFLKYAVGSYNYYKNLSLLIPVFIKFFTGIYTNSNAKEKVISFFFKGWDINDFSKLSDSYSEFELKKIINNNAIDKIEWHKENKHKVVVVSASIEYYLRKWCENFELDLIGTKLEIKENKLSGKFHTPNCNGEEKVIRIQKEINLSEFNKIYAYGNSKGDLPMLNLADYKFYKCFN
jgi:phosphatidylglycerophosphatase C